MTVEAYSSRSRTCPKPLFLSAKTGHGYSCIGAGGSSVVIFGGLGDLVILVVLRVLIQGLVTASDKYDKE